MKIVSTALIAAVLVAGSTGAFAKQREAVSFGVSTQGINFSDPASVAKFRERVARQIAVACAPAADEVATGAKPDFGCRQSMTTSADTRIAQLMTNSNSAMATVD